MPIRRAAPPPAMCAGRRPSGLTSRARDPGTYAGRDPRRAHRFHHPRQSPFRIRASQGSPADGAVRGVWKRNSVRACDRWLSAVSGLEVALPTFGQPAGGHRLTRKRRRQPALGHRPLRCRGFARRRSRQAEQQWLAYLPRIRSCCRRRPSCRGLSGPRREHDGSMSGHRLHFDERRPELANYRLTSGAASLAPFMVADRRCARIRGETG